ncbi:MAG TPA: hypothetical protein VHT25_01000 [Solirubrobacteraceae bacterium]|nr:hypothetical protein [Solirubrobacteraceae bacterium]
MNKTVNMRGRRGRIIAVLLVAVLGTSLAAWAYWSAPSKGNTSGHVATFGAPTISNATPGAGTVELTWSAVTAPAGGTVTYYVARDGGAPSSACPGSASPSSTTSCTDTGVSIGKHSYTVTAVWRSWTGTSASASAQVTTGPATHLLLAPTTATPAAGAGDNLTITAQDASNNVVTAYSGDKTLTFGGASSAGGSQPTVTSAGGTAVAFGTAETVSFSGGKAAVSGSSNGVMTLCKAETAKITVSDGTLSNGSGTSVTVSAGSPSNFTVPTPSTQTAGTPFNETLTAVDAYGNTATSYTGSRTIAFSGPANSPNATAPKYPSSTIKFTAGVSESFPITLYKAEAPVLTAKEGSISGSSGSFAVNAASAKSFTLAALGSQTAGTAFEETLTAKDEYGNTATSYTGGRTIAFSGPANSHNATAPKYPSSTIKFTAGVSESFPVTLYKAETPTLKATEGSISGSVGLTVAAAAASKFTVPTPSTQTAGKEFSETLTAIDLYGNTATSFSGPKTIAFTGPTTSPDGHAPKYPGTVNFSSGEGTAAITVYDAGSMALGAEEGSINGKSTSFTVNGLSTTSKFLLSTPSPTAGAQFTETVTATDSFGNTTTGYTGSHTLTFSGPAKSPNFTSPKYPSSSTSFTAGVGTPSITLYDAQTTALKASASGVSESESDPFTVVSAAPSSMSVSTPGAQTAGVAFSVSITGAKDAYGNTVAGSQAVSFANPSNAPDGTAPSYPSTATFSGGEAKPSITLDDAQTTTLKVTSGTASATTSSFTVGPAAMSALALTAASSTVTAGEGDELTIKAVDAFENTVTSYPTSKSLKFTGAKASGAKSPTVTNSLGSATAFGATTAITFSNGVAKVSGTSNGLMRLYALETANVTVSDGTFTSAPLPVTVQAALISSLALENNGFKEGTIEKGDSFTVEFGSALAVNTMCSAWTGNTTNHAMSGNNEVTVTVSDGAGATDDVLSVSSSACTFHLGTIDLGSNAYVSGGSATFGGSGSNKSSLEYKASSHSLEIRLGSKAGTGTIAKASPSAATLTPDASLTDEFGNTFAPFTTATTAQF